MSRPFLVGFFIAATAFSQTPSITQVLNNYGLEPLGSSQNSGIAQGSIFIVKGANLSDQSAGLQNAPLSTTLQGVRIRITVSGVTTYAPIYYVLPAQLAGILPSNTPPGSGNIVVENNGRASAPSPAQVVKSAFGILTMNGAATGMAVVQDQDYVLLSRTNAANPGNYLVFYGSGIGATTKDETVAQTDANASGDLTNVPVTVTIGGKDAAVLYRGRTTFPGLDQINVQVPVLDPDSYSCGVIVYIRAGDVYSNVTRIPVAESGKTCTDPPINRSKFPDLTLADVDRIQSGNAKLGSLTFVRVSAVTPSATGGTMLTQTSTANSAFLSLSGPDLRNYFGDAARPDVPVLVPPAVGSCSVIETSSIAPFVPSPPSTYYDIAAHTLDAGDSLSIQWPGGSLKIPRIATTVDPTQYVYIEGTTDNLPSGPYTFSGAGGADIGAFSTTFNMKAPLTLTNRESLQTVTRADGLRITWSGGDPTQQVSITGISSNLDISTSITRVAAFLCIANQGDGSFMVPGSVLSRLPASGSLGSFVAPGTVGISGTNNPVRVNIPGVDYFYVSNSTTESTPVTLR